MRRSLQHHVIGNLRSDMAISADSDRRPELLLSRLELRRQLALSVFIRRRLICHALVQAQTSWKFAPTGYVRSYRGGGSQVYM